MGKKARTTLTIDAEVLQKAHKIGLNVSQFCENALKDAIQRLEQPKTQTNGGTPFLGEASLSKKVQWCGRRDLNPGRRRGRPRS